MSFVLVNGGGWAVGGDEIIIQIAEKFREVIIAVPVGPVSDSLNAIPGADGVIWRTANSR